MGFVNSMRPITAVAELRVSNKQFTVLVYYFTEKSCRSTIWQFVERV